MDKDFLLPQIVIKPNPAIAGKVAIVTGASSGIGEATARELAMGGAKVVLAARRIERLKRTADLITSAGGTALPVQTDLTQHEQIRNLVAATIKSFGRIDILCNNAGWGRYDWLEELSEHNLRNQYDVNIIGMTELTRQVVPAMKAQRSGHIINISSYGSKISTPPLTIYCSTKYAVEGFTDGLRRELLPWGIYVSRVHPSGVKGTEFNQKAAQDGGIRLPVSPIGKVTLLQVAREITGLIERPRRYRFLSRWYDVPVVLDSLFPGLTDFVMKFWVRNMRRDQLKDNQPAGQNIQPAHYRGFSAGALLVLLLAAGAFVLKALSRPPIPRSPLHTILSAGKKMTGRKTKTPAGKRLEQVSYWINLLLG